MEYKVTGLIPSLTFNYSSGTCVNVSSPERAPPITAPKFLMERAASWEAARHTNSLV